MKRSKFNLSHHKLLSCDMGELIPIGLTEVLPGDTIQQNTTALVRVSPLLSPVMHPVHCSISHWFVPHRLVWEDFEDFITGGPDGADASVFPTLALTGGMRNVGELADYLGVPPTTPDPLTTSALPFRGYAMIWNEFFRDQDLDTALGVSKASGTDGTTARTLQRVSWEKDYFTSARPWEQKGPSITVPIGTTAPVLGIGKSNATFANAAQTVRESDGTTSVYATAAPIAGDPGTPNSYWQGEQNASTGFPNIRADLTGASAVTINALREAFALQRFEEARARFGSRYVEYLRYLGVRSSDARLQRPEFLGGGRYPLQFSEVVQTAEGTDPVGELRGHGIGVARSARFRRYMEEHGYIFTLMHVRPKTIYAQGLSRTWNRRTREDFFQKELQHIGQQAVQNQEVYLPHASPTGTFGYQDRYDEYRRSESSIAGEFRTTLDFWHFARQFGSDPALNATFTNCVPTEEPFAVPSQDVLYVMAKHRIGARRIVAGSGQSFIY